MAKDRLNKRELLKPRVLGSYVPGLKKVINRDTNLDCADAQDIPAEDIEHFIDSWFEAEEEPNPLEEVPEDKAWREAEFDEPVG
jgi:hypothetical protein